MSTSVGSWGLRAALVGLCGSLVAPAVGAKPRVTATMPVSEVKPGMKGYAVTVFSGEQTDRFEIEVVDVIPHYLPKQDAVLFKSSDPRLKHSGIVGGMSGSPIFVGGKLLGALAYGWRFNKDPLGGLTPIDNMREVGKLPYRPDVLPRPTPRGRKRRGSKAWADTMLGLQRSPLPARHRPDDVTDAGGLTPLSVPLSVAGLGPSSTRMIGEAFGMAPVRGGGSPAKAGKPKAWAPGDAVSVVLIRGDSGVAGNGTVTWVGPKGKQLLAFGHSMFSDGPSNIPMGNARVHTIINSVDRSVKLSSPLTIQGLMYQDRQPAIALRTDLRAPMIPVQTTMVGPDPDLKGRVYDNEVAVGLDITPNLLGVILAEAADEAGRDATEVVLGLHHTYELTTTKGPRTIDIDEELFFPSGLVGRMLTRSRGVIVAAAMLDNEFEVAKIRRVSQRIEMKYGAPVDEIVEVRAPAGEVRAGDVARLRLVLRNYKGVRRTETVPVRIPDDAGGEDVQVIVAGGDYARPQRPMPGNLDDLLTTLEQAYPSRSLVVSVYREAEGLSTRHGLMRQLPDSVLESLMNSGSTIDAVRLKQLSRRVIPRKSLIEGTHSIKIEVKKAKTF